MSVMRSLCRAILLGHAVPKKHLKHFQKLRLKVVETTALKIPTELPTIKPD